MYNVNETRRKLHDQLLKNNRCKFIYQVHLLPQLMQQISNTGIVTLPAGARETIEALITDEQKLQCRGVGIECVGYDAHHILFSLALTCQDNTYELVARWSNLFERDNIKAFDAISFWVSEGRNAPKFYFRFDGVANEGEPLPHPPNMECQESNEAVRQKCGHCSII